VPQQKIKVHIRGLPRQKLGATWAQNQCVKGPKVDLQVSKGSRINGTLVGAVGIETTAAWHFNDLRSRARYEKEGLGSPWNPYCRLNAAFFPMMLRTTLRFASRTAFGIACV
jgi:hypothetical protein